ncbi:MAG: NUDIX domain-containing protein, partial [Candidatus Thalassarchaeaceae archaeon]
RVSNLIQQGEKYDAIIQLGLAESRNKISLERWAHNHSKFRIPDNSGRMVEEIILERGPEKYQTTVSKHILDEEFENDEDIVWSNSAGQFVCNETIYRTLNSIELMGGKIPAIFVHLPQESEISFTRQMEVISRIIKTLASKPRLEVVGALLFNPERRILACRRPPQDVWAGWWEFPGGKIDEGETEKEALRREIMEELGIIVNPKSRVAALQYEYEDRFVSLSIWDCGVVDQESIVAKEHDLISWLDQSSLNTVKWLPADEPLIEEWMKSGIPYS